MNRRNILIAMLLALLVGGVVGILVSPDPDPLGDGFCPLDAPLAEPPDGWEFQRDRANDCAMTLIDNAGRRAPVELYEGQPIDPPPPLPLNRVRLASVVAVFLSLVGLSLMWLADRRRRFRGLAD
ncbi:MAG: hypothetical protein QNJ89_15265 [Acidimicrobiia bacterium]|nr:hypothetical protein [Acidimicrobiia bacterium]